MAGVIHDEGEAFILGLMTGDSARPTNYKVGLFQEVTGLAEDDAIGDVVEPSGYGYAQEDTASASGVISVDGDYHRLTFAEVTFTASGGSIQADGWFIYDSTAGLLFSALFSTPRTVADGDSIDVEPYIRIK